MCKTLCRLIEINLELGKSIGAIMPFMNEIRAYTKSAEMKRSSGKYQVFVWCVAV